MRRYRIAYEIRHGRGCTTCRWARRTGIIEAERKPTPAEAARMVRQKWRELNGDRVRVRGMTVRWVR